MGKIEKITIHWTAGTNKMGSTDKDHYHFIIDGDGVVHTGKYKPQDNINCNDGVYAQHCGGGNTGNLGISMCGMAGFKDRNHVGNYPLTKKQVEAMFKLVAEQCIKFGITPNENTVFTHMEFGKKHPTTSSAGKIDICYLPPYPEVKSENIGSFIRNKVLWYYHKLKG